MLSITDLTASHIIPPLNLKSLADLEPATHVAAANDEDKLTEISSSVVSIFFDCGSW